MKHPCQEYTKETIQTSKDLWEDGRFIHGGVCRSCDFAIRIISKASEPTEEEKEFIVEKICEHGCKYEV